MGTSNSFSLVVYNAIVGSTSSLLLVPTFIIDFILYCSAQSRSFEKIVILGTVPYTRICDGEMMLLKLLFTSIFLIHAIVRKQDENKTQ